MRAVIKNTFALSLVCLIVGAFLGYCIRAEQPPRWRFIRQSADVFYRVQEDTGHAEVTYGDGEWHTVTEPLKLIPKKSVDQGGDMR